MDKIKITGLSIVAIKGDHPRVVSGCFKNISTEVVLSYIFLSDGETYISFYKQDNYEFHDADSKARVIYVDKDKEAYERLMKDLDSGDANQLPNGKEIE